jgi:DNA-binding NarL/FixJ family response regulator
MTAVTDVGDDAAPPRRVRLVIADDQEVVRVGWSTILQASGAVDVVAAARDGNALVRAVVEHQPDLALVDVRMPGLDGLSALELLSSAGLVGRGSCRVLVVTTFDHDAYVDRALLAGASGFLLKTVTTEELLDAVAIAMRGESTLAPSTTTRLIDRYLTGSTTHDESVLAPLTARERVVLELVGHGLSNQEICARLYVAPNTVKTHISRLLAKLGARDRAQLVVAAHRGGLVRPGHRRHPGG